MGNGKSEMGSSTWSEDGGRDDGGEVGIASTEGECQIGQIDENKLRRLDAAWVATEVGFEAQARRLPPSKDNFVGDVGAGHGFIVSGENGYQPHLRSSLMAHPSDATLRTSNLQSQGRKPNDGEVGNGGHVPAGARPLHPRDFESQRDGRVGARWTGDPLVRAEKGSQMPQCPTSGQTILQKYRNFLRRHEPSLDLIEMAMERFVFYGILLKHDRSGFGAEMYYAAWNLMRWINDVVLVGLGEGMGTTVGRREEWLPRPVTQKREGKTGPALFSCDSVLSRMNSVVPILRSLVMVTTCVYPAIEAWSRRPLSSRPPVGAPLPFNDNDGNPAPQDQEECQMATALDVSPQRRRLKWESGKWCAARMSFLLERVRFLSRVALLSISWWAQRRRWRRGDNRTSKKLLLVNDNFSERMTPPSLLRRGGDLDPNEEILTLKEVEEEEKVVQYVGRRTGRRSITRASMNAGQDKNLRSSRSRGSTFVKWILGMSSSQNRIFCIHVIGELLHVLRPFHSSHAESKNRSSLKKTHSMHTLAMWKAWWISFLMDLVSDRLLRVSHDGDSSSSAKQANFEELEWRRSRHGLYLLRSPMYDVVTRPLARFIAKFTSIIPSFGLGKWASEYVLDMMHYWNDNHFMLES